MNKLKRILVVVLACVLMLTTMTTSVFADGKGRGNGNGRGNGKGNGGNKGSEPSTEVVSEEETNEEPAAEEAPVNEEEAAEEEQVAEEEPAPEDASDTGAVEEEAAEETVTEETVTEEPAAEDTSDESEIPEATETETEAEEEPVDAGTAVRKAAFAPRIGLMAAGDDAEVGVPDASKELVENGDGTATLSLSITGQKVTTPDNHKANVVIVLDRSASMRWNTPYTYADDTYIPDAYYYETWSGRSDNTDIPDNATRVYYVKGGVNGDGWYTNSAGTSGHYTGTVYTTRLTAQRAALKIMVDLLFEQNIRSGVDDLIEIKIISFAGVRGGYYYNSGSDPDGDLRNTESAWVSGTDSSVLNGIVNSTSTMWRTNWQAALQYAKEVADDKQAQQDQADDSMFVVFITDGQPTVYGKGTPDNSGNFPLYSPGAGNNITSYNAFINNATYHNAMERNGYVASGTGGTAGVSNWTVAQYASYDPAKDIVDVDYHLYSIFAFGANADVATLRNTHNFAYSNAAPDDTFFDGRDIAGLRSAFESIASSITNAVAYGQVSFTDGVAGDVTASSLVSGKPDGFKYIVSKGGKVKDGGTEVYSVTAADNNGTPVVKFNISGNEYDGALSSEGYYYAVDANGNAVLDSEGKEYKMALATYDGTKVVWDLNAIGMLEPLTYTVEFIVWPNQDAYNYVADLNNGVNNATWNYSTQKPLMEADGVTQKKDANGNLLWYNGSSDYPSIVRAGTEQGSPDDVYSILTNTDQQLNYSIATAVYDEEGNLIRIDYVPGDPLPLDPAKPMELTKAESTITKKWNAGLDKDQLIGYLYDTYTGESLEKAIEFTVSKDGAEYKKVKLGWIVDEEHPNGYYNWADETEMITYYGFNYEIGTMWQSDFFISTGIMLDEDHMELHGLDKSRYTVVDVGGVNYYILDEGYDYTVSEPELDTYSFDFVNKVYHPMLVNGTMMNVTFEKSGETITGVTDMEPMEDGIRVDNTLRGGINLSKAVVDRNGETFNTDDKFIFNIQLNNATEDTFEGDDIPWYAINELYYHDADWNLYQASNVNYKVSPVEFKLKDESGTTYDATSPDFSEQEGPATVTYTKNGETVTISLYGNVLTPNANGTEATGTVEISQNDSLRIANVPMSTDYTIVEDQSIKGYTLIDIYKEIQESGGTPKPVEDGIDLENYTVTGIIEPNHENNLIFTNQISEEAFYVYHSSDVTVEKIYFSDARVEKVYDETIDPETEQPAGYQYSFNMIDETKKGYFYGGYYKGYGKTESSDADIMALTYTAADTKQYEYAVKAKALNNWAADPNGQTYAGSDANGNDTTIWNMNDAVKGAYTEAGNAVSPAVNTVYYLKEVPETYLQPATYVVYDKNDVVSNCMQVKKLYLMTATDDGNYKSVGFDVTLSSHLTKKGMTSGQKTAEYWSTKIEVVQNNAVKDTLYADSIQSGAYGLLAAYDIRDYLVTNAYYREIPYWITPDQVKVTGNKQMIVMVKNTRFNNWTSPGMTKSAVTKTPAYLPITAEDYDEKQVD